MTHNYMYYVPCTYIIFSQYMHKYLINLFITLKKKNKFIIIRHKCITTLFFVISRNSFNFIYKLTL